MENAVYFVDHPADDERHACFIPTDMSSVLGFGPKAFEKDFEPSVPEHRDWQPHRLKDVWKPREVFGDRDRVKPYNDYPTLVGIPAFSQKAVDALRDFLEPNGEILPLITPPKLGPYYAYNTTTVADVLDIQRSSGVTFFGNDEFLISDICRFEFREDKLQGLSIFRIPEYTRKIFVTDVFVQRVREHKLWGMLFDKVWPLPPGVDWWKLAMQNTYDHLTPAGKRRWDARNKRSSKKPKSLGKITSGPIDDEHASALAEAREENASELRLAVEPRTPLEIQEWIHDEVARLQVSDEPIEEKKERAFNLAIAWGDSLVEEMGWEWVMLTAESGEKTVAVASPNRSHAVPVLGYLSKLVSSSTVDNTSLLLFNMIRAGDMGKGKAGENVLLG
jgi:hypothetical protein